MFILLSIYPILLFYMSTAIIVYMAIVYIPVYFREPFVSIIMEFLHFASLCLLKLITNIPKATTSQIKVSIVFIYAYLFCS